MKNIFESFLVALSMYSKIPLPNINWNNNNMKYSMSFLPLIGIIIGVIINLWYNICITFDISQTLFAAVCVIIPVFISGGIHLDGFIDTNDGINSYADKEKRLEILKDVHVGAFSVIMCNVYFILSFGLWNELYKYPKMIFVSVISYVISRTIGAYVQVWLKCAKDTGLSKIFSDSSDKKTVKIILIFWFILSIAFLALVNFLIAVILFSSVFFILIWFKKMSYEMFGGITGDLAGYLLTIIELISLSVFVVGGVIFY